MIRIAAAPMGFLALAFFGLTSGAQTLAPSSAGKADAANFETLSKKIDEQTVKIDALSQQILKLEHQLSTIRPGVMIGETTPAPAAAVSTPTAAANANGNTTHVVARGETLTSIAKMHHVTIEELQKFNHIENDRKLQIGQSLLVPPPPTSPSPTAKPNE